MPKASALAFANAGQENISWGEPRVSRQKRKAPTVKTPSTNNEMIDGGTTIATYGTTRKKAPSPTWTPNRTAGPFASRTNAKTATTQATVMAMAARVLFL